MRHHVSLFFTYHCISFVFLLYDLCICTHSVDHSLTHFLVEFPSLGLALVHNVVVPDSEQGCATAHGPEISIQISALAGVEHRTLASSGRKRYHKTTARPSF